MVHERIRVNVVITWVPQEAPLMLIICPNIMQDKLKIDIIADDRARMGQEGGSDNNLWAMAGQSCRVKRI